MKNKGADGLRGVAAFNVVIAHFVAAFLPAMLHKNYPTIFAENKSPSALFDVLTSPFVSIFYNGHFAVLVFFVLSGYVLTIPYFNEGTQNLLHKRLWARYLRLNIPIAASIALSLVVYKLGLYVNVPAAEITGSTSWLKNFFPAGATNTTAFLEALFDSIIFGSSTFVPPLWTLKIEFIGSLYLLLFYIAKPQKKTLVPMVLALLLVYAIHKSESMYYIAIFAGSLLNLMRVRCSLKPVMFVAGVYFGAFQFESVWYSFLPSWNFWGVEVWETKTFYNAIGAFLITAAVVKGFGARVFESRVAQFLGRISMSMYLLHFMVLCSLSCAILLNFPYSKAYLLANFVIYIVACLAISILFEMFVDRKAIKVSHRFADFVFDGKQR